MNIDKTDNIKFGTGNVFLKRINPDKISSYQAIKKIAEDRDIDIFIIKNNGSKYVPNMYAILVSKEPSAVSKRFAKKWGDIKHSLSCVVANGKIKKEELAVKIYNAVMNTIEALDKNFAVNK